MFTSDQNLLKICLICIATIFSIAGCEESFQPIEENNEYYYSVYGFLDTNADTQWVRIMPVRETVEYSDEPIDATVTLEDVDTGEITTMNDSLFVLPRIDDNDALVWNFWTTMELSPSHSYTLTVERSDGATTTTTVDIPDEYPEPDINFNYVEVNEVDNIADARVNWKVLDKRFNTTHHFSIPQNQIIVYRNSAKFRIVIYPNSDFVNTVLKSLEASQPQIEILETDLVLSVAGSDWIEFSELDREFIALPKATSNIENGVGYLVGSIRKTLPYPVCVGDEQVIIACEPNN